MSWIIITRNPKTKKLLPILCEDNETIAEYETESIANSIAMAVPICEAWGYESIEVNFPSG